MNSCFLLYVLWLVSVPVWPPSHKAQTQQVWRGQQSTLVIGNVKGTWIHKTGLKLNLGCACSQIDPSYFTSLGASTFQAAQAPLVAGSPATAKKSPPQLYSAEEPSFLQLPTAPEPLCVSTTACPRNSTPSR